MKKIDLYVIGTERCNFDNNWFINYYNNGYEIWFNNETETFEVYNDNGEMYYCGKWQKNAMRALRGEYIGTDNGEEC